MYSKMLYMQKTRVTFRVEADLADALRELPNQTRFVEDALRDALGRTCPVCRGDGRLQVRRLRVSNVRRQGIKRLNRDQAQQLQRIYRMGQELAATRIDLRRQGRRVEFSLRREQHEILAGVLSPQTSN
jgi:hypothetical protein